MISIDDVPKRIFIDSSVLQTMLTYSGYIFDGGGIAESDPIWSIPEGKEKLQALRWICLVNQRTAFEWVLSSNSIDEVLAKGSSSYLQWAYEVMLYWQECLQGYGGKLNGSGEHLAKRLDETHFGYLGEGDKRLLRDAVLFECEAFLTMERRLPRNASHIQRELGIRVLTPIQYWQMLGPWAGLYV
jgi:hypothetical protein